MARQWGKAAAALAKMHAEGWPATQQTMITTTAIKHVAMHIKAQTMRSTKATVNYKRS